MNKNCKYQKIICIFAENNTRNNYSFYAYAEFFFN